MQGQLKDENYIVVSKPYTILSDRLQHLNAEIERYRGLVDVLQVPCFSSLVLFCIGIVFFYKKWYFFYQLFLYLSLE